jgi:hypothetical protein
MVSLTCSASRTEGVTLVTGRVENGDDDRAYRVRLESQFDGPVWPPRRRGRPAAGWDADGFECVLAAGETRALGYASPARPVEPPLVVADTDPVDPDIDDTSFTPRVAVPEVEDTPDGVVRALGSPAPPRDAVPDPDPVAVQPQPAYEPETHENGDDEPPSNASRVTERATRDGADVDDGPVPGDGSRCAGVTDPVEAWLGTVAARVERGEALADATRVPAATDAVADAGGLAGVRSLDEQLVADATRLREVADRAARLADRVEAVEIPVETLSRLA